MFVAVVGLVVWKLSQPQYKNDDYGIPQPTAHAPPQPPEVKDPAEWDAIVRQNVLYQQTLDTPPSAASSRTDSIPPGPGNRYRNFCSSR